ncbi:MAG: TIR domain-containing protein [Bryobacteraceae bacterium]
MPPTPRDFYISYNKADRPAAEWIANTLQAAGYTTIIQSQDFAPGSNFVLEMHAAAQQAKRTIAVLSQDFLDSAFTAPEWAAAFAKDPRGQSRILVPVRVRLCDPTGLLGQIVYINLADLDLQYDEPQARKRLLEGIDGMPQPPARLPRKLPRPLLALGALGLLVAAAVYGLRTHTPDLYRVRVTVTTPQGIPTEDAKVWSTAGGEPKKVAGGWEFTIPHATRPADGNLTVYATVEAAFQKGTASTHLESDANPALRITLASDTSASIRGAVIDSRRRPLGGVRVSVIGHEQTITTDAAGNFSLPAHASPGQQVQVRADKSGYEVATAWHPAGDTPVELILEPAGK